MFLLVCIFVIINSNKNKLKPFFLHEESRDKD